MTITLTLSGLHCGNCVKSVEKALHEVTVTLSPQQAIVEGEVEAQTLIDAIDDIGFEATIA